MADDWRETMRDEGRELGAETVPAWVLCVVGVAMFDEELRLELE